VSIEFDPWQIQLYSAFGSLQSRLHEIENYNRELIPDPTSRRYYGNINEECLRLPAEISFSYLGVIIEQVRDSYESFKDNIEYIKGLIDQSYPDDDVFESKDFNFRQECKESEINKTIDELNKEFTGYLKELERLAAKLEKRIESSGSSIITDKLQFNMTVEELTAFIRLLKEAEIIADIPNTQIASIIKLHFYTKSRVDLQKGKLIKALSPSEDSLDKIEELLQKMLLKCKQMQK
jgi:uncharacterized coiled-coil protein SlyX